MRHDFPPGTPCYNCGAVLQGRWCFACGQAAHDFHRNAWHLGAEAAEDFFHADGRLWRTLRRLVSNPARLTREYLAGRRASQMPPLRLFLVALLILFLIGNWATRGVSLLHLENPPADVQAEINQAKVDLGLPAAWNAAATTWLRGHVSRAIVHPDDLGTAMRDRAETFAFFMLPISALILSLIFVARRGVVLFDHLVFSMHSLAFQGLLISLAILVRAPWPLVAAPVHLFAHLRGVYGLGVAGTLVRMAVLFVATAVAFALLLLGLVVAGLQGLRA